MEQHELTIKLKVLRNTVAKWLEDARAIFDYQSVQDLFSRYNPLRDALRSEYPSLLGDLPVRTMQIETAGNSTYINRRSLDLLLKDIEYCLDILSSITTVDVPSMKVTREGGFFAGQYFDALRHVTEILSHAQRSIVIIDGYINEDVLKLLTPKGPEVEVNILTKDVSPALSTAATAFNKQYGKLSIRTSQAFHDRFVIVDARDFYHFGASIKDLGHRGFMFSRLEEPEVIDALRTKWAEEWAKATVAV